MVKAFIAYQQNRLYNLNSDDGLPGDDIYSMANDKNGKIWIATDGGIVQCNIDKGQKRNRDIFY